MSFDSGDFVFCTCDEHESEEYDDRSEDWSVVCPWSEGEDWGGNPEWVSARAIARSGPEDWGVEWPWSDDEDRGGSPEWVRPRVIARESGPWGKNGEGEEGESEDKQVESEDEEGGTGEVYEEEGQDYDADFEEKGEEEGQDHNELQAYEDSEEREEEHEEGQEYVEDSKEPDHEGGEEEYKEEYEEEDGSEDIQQSDYQMAMEKSRCSSTPSQPALVSEAREWEAKSGSNNNHSPRARPEMAGTAIIVTLRAASKAACTTPVMQHGMAGRLMLLLLQGVRQPVQPEPAPPIGDSRGQGFPVRELWLQYNRGMSGLIEHIELEKCRFMSRDRFL